MLEKGKKGEAKTEESRFALLSKLRACNMSSAGFMHFYQDKVEKGRAERKSKQDTVKTSTLVQLTRRQQHEQEEWLEEVQSELNSHQREAKALRLKQHELAHQGKVYQQQITALKEENMVINARVSMNLVIKEIHRRSKYAFSECLPFSNINAAKSKAKSKAISMGEVLFDQLQNSGKYRSVIKFAYHWLYLTRKRKKERAIK